MVDLKVRDNAVHLPVKVVPGASRTRQAGVLDGRVKIAVAAPPEKGKANAELVQFLAKTLGLRKRDVAVIDGLTNARKLVRIENIAVDDVRNKLKLTEATDIDKRH